MKIVVDLDGVIISLPPSYKDKDKVIFDYNMVEFLKHRKRLGDYIIIFSSNGMNSNNNDIGKVYTKNYVRIFNLLKDNDVPFDELILGKPNADIYIDDKAIRYTKYYNLNLPYFIITAAGAGNRTKDISNLPKPVIPILGKPMLYWAMKSLPLDIAQKIILIYRDDIVLETFKTSLSELGYNDYFIDEKLEHVKIDKVTRGQAETVLYAENLIDNSPIVIYNIDTYFRSYYIKSKLLTFSNKYEGIIGGFYAKNPALSFIKVDNDKVVDIEEKKVISEIATTGLYGFKNFSIFKHYYDNYVDEIIKNYREAYIAPIYKYMIADGREIWYDIGECAYTLGSKTEVEEFERFFKSQDQC